MFFVMAIAGMVCTALCVSGQFMTDLKTGYWLGNTPAAQEKVKFLGMIAAAAAAGLTIVLLAHTYQFGECRAGRSRPILAAPQASIMKALVVGFMSRQPVTYLLFGVGALITVVMEMLGKSSMVFALGIYLPLNLTTPSSPADFCRTSCNRRSEKTGGEPGHGIRERGIILASGLMAGGALGGVLGAALRLIPGIPRRSHPDAVLFERSHLGFAMCHRPCFLRGLCFYVWLGAIQNGKGEVMNQLDLTYRRRDSRHRHALGRRRHVPLGHGPLHRRLAGSPMSRCPPPTRIRPPRACANPAAWRQSHRPRRHSKLSARRRSSRRHCRAFAKKPPGARTAPAYLDGPRRFLDVMWDLAMEVLGKGDPVPYARAVEASTGKPPEPSHPEKKRERVAELLGRAGTRHRNPAEFSPPSMPGVAIASRPWHRCSALGQAVIAHFRRAEREKPLPHLAAGTRRRAARQHRLPAHQGRMVLRLDELHWPRAQRDGAPEYEASYEINASLQISYPEFEQLVSHEVVPGHVTTFAYLQDLYVRGKAGFEASCSP
jgi:hypothetical protein